MANQRKTGHKLFATAATAAMVAIAIAPAASAAEMKFTDVEGQYVAPVQFLIDNEITNGVTATTFGTHLPITRGQAAIFLAKALGLDTVNAPDAGFKDANDRDDRTRTAINAIKEKGILQGVSTTEFGTDLPMNRQALAVAIANAYELTGDIDLPFTDVYENSPYEASIKALYANDITKGVSDTLFGSNVTVTRGQFAVFLHKAELATQTAEEVEVNTVSALNTSTFVVTAKEVAETSAAAVDVTGKVQMNVTLDGKAWEVLSVTDNQNGTYTVEVADLDGKKGTLAINGKEMSIDYSADALKAAIQAVKDASQANLVAALQAPVLNLTDVKADYAAEYYHAVNTEKVFINDRTQLQSNLINYINGQFAKAITDALTDVSTALDSYAKAFSVTAQESAFVELQAALDTLDTLGLDNFNVKFASTTEGSEGLLGDKVESKTIATLYVEQLVALDELSLENVQAVIDLANDLDKLRDDIDASHASDNGSLETITNVVKAYEAATTYVNDNLVAGDAKESFQQTLAAVAEDAATRVNGLVATFTASADALTTGSAVADFEAALENYYNAKGLADRLPAEAVTKVELDKALDQVLLHVLQGVNEQLDASIATSGKSLNEIAEGGTIDAGLNSIEKIDAVEAALASAKEVVAVLEGTEAYVDEENEISLSAADFNTVLTNVEKEIELASKELYGKVNTATTEAELLAAFEGIGSPAGTTDQAVRELFILANGDKVYTSISEVKEDLADIVVISAINVANETNRAELPTTVKAFVTEFGNDAYINLKPANREEVFGFFHFETMNTTLKSVAEVDAALTDAVNQYNSFIASVNSATDITTTRAALQEWVDLSVDVYGDAETAHDKVVELDTIAVNGTVTIEAATNVFAELEALQNATQPTEFKTVAEILTAAQ